MEFRKEFNYPLESINKNVELFEEMAREGWILKKYGSYKSTYERVEPQNLKFYILPKKAFKNENEIYQSLIDAGWRVLTENMGSRVLIIDRAAPGASMELPKEYLQQMLKDTRRKTLRFTPLYALGILLPVILELFRRGMSYNPIYEFFYALNNSFTLTVMLILLLLSFVFVAFFDSMEHKKRLLISEGKLPAKRLTSKNLAISIATMVFLICFTIFAVSQVSSKDIPTVPDGPYPVLSDFHIEHAPVPTDGSQPIFRSGNLRKSNSPFSTFYDVMDDYDNRVDDISYMVYSDVFVMKNERYRDLMLETLDYKLNTGEFEIERLELNGFDGAFQVGGRSLLVKGNTIWLIRYVNTDLEKVTDNPLIYSINEGIVDFDKIKNR